MDAEKPLAYYRIKRAIFAPFAVSLASVFFVLIDSAWNLLAVPFALLGSFCARPNLNAADGCLAYFSILVGFMLSFFHVQSGIAICAGTFASFLLSGLEMNLTATPVEHQENK